LPLPALPPAPSEAMADPQSDELLQTVFQCFDIDHSGSISLDELLSAAKVLGIRARPEQIADSFKNADSDNSGAIDFDEFCQLIEDSDGGHFSRMIQKMKDDVAIRDVMKSRNRPNRIDIGGLDEQLDALCAEKEWYTTFHLYDMQSTKEASARGFPVHRPEASTFKLSSVSPRTTTPLPPVRSARRQLPEPCELAPTAARPATSGAGLAQHVHTKRVIGGSWPSSPRVCARLDEPLYSPRLDDERPTSSSYMCVSMTHITGTARPARRGFRGFGLMRDMRGQPDALRLAWRNHCRAAI